MAMEITKNYNGYAAQNMAESSTVNSTKNKGTEKTAQAAKNRTEYAAKLAKLVPSVEFKVGNAFSSAQNGITLTVSPKILEKMQNDPEQEKETMELIKGVEAAAQLFDGIYKASGWEVVFRHGYIDENGKYRQVSLIRNEFGYKMSEKLREERRENAEKLIEKTKEKAARKKEELQESETEKREEEKTNEKAEKAEKREGKAEKKTAANQAEQLLEEKMATSKDGMIYLYDTDMRRIIDAMNGEKEGKAGTKEQTEAGANLDLQV